MKLSASAAAESFSWLSLLGISDAAAASENPYDFSNMECAWYDGEGGVFEGVMYFTDETNGGVQSLLSRWPVYGSTNQPVCPHTL